MNLQRANAKRKMAALAGILIWYAQKREKKKDKKRWLCTNNKPTEEIIEKDQPPEDELELRFLFLSHVKGLIRGNAPVRIRVSMDRVDALLAFVRASAGLSLPDSRTTFCKV